MPLSNSFGNLAPNHKHRPKCQRTTLRTLAFVFCFGIAGAALAYATPAKAEDVGSGNSWESDHNVRKYDHFSLSVVGTEVFLKSGQLVSTKHDITLFNRLVSSVLMLGVGVSKEIYDMRQTKLPFNRRDIGYDALGILTGNILTYQF